MTFCHVNFIYRISSLYNLAGTVVGCAERHDMYCICDLMIDPSLIITLLFPHFPHMTGSDNQLHFIDASCTSQGFIFQPYE